VSSLTADRENPIGGIAALVFAIASILVFAGFALWFWVQAPDVVASHFDSSGQPDDWSSKASALAWLVPLGVGLPVLLSIRPLWKKLPKSLINIPFKEYWLESGEETFLFDSLMQFLRIVAGLSALLFASVLVMIMREGRSATMPEWMTFVPTVVFSACIGLALWHLVRRLRPPR
jgi:uncharacterized membrane protein